MHWEKKLIIAIEFVEQILCGHILGFYEIKTENR